MESQTVYTFVPKIFVCRAQTFSVNATIVKLTVAPPSNCIVTTYRHVNSKTLTLQSSIKTAEQWTIIQ